MKYLLVTLAALSLLGTAPAMAGSGKKVSEVLKTPVLMQAGSSPRMAVNFNHSSHKGISCTLCHHMATSDDALFVSCTNEECHATPGARERDTMSLFMAYHDKAAERSCYGCHKQRAAEHPEFVGCRPCHMSPMARAAASAQK